MVVWKIIKSSRFLKIIFLFILAFVITIIILTIINICIRFTTLTQDDPLYYVQLESLEQSITMFSILTALLSGIIALLIPFLMKNLDKEDKKNEINKTLKKVLEIIKNIIIYQIHDWYEFNDEGEKQKMLNRLKKESILSSIEYLKQNREILYMINTIFRDNEKKPTFPGEAPKELYDIVLMDYITIRIIIISGVRGIEYYSVDSIKIINTNTNESDNQIKLIDYKNLFEKIIELCKKEYDFDV